MKGVLVPRYYLNLYNDEVVRDETGEDFADAGAARESAVRGIAELIAEHIVAGKPVDLSDRIEIEDEQRKLVAVITYAEMFHGRAAA